MNKDQFEKYMASSGVTDEKSILELKEVLDKFPYFQIARMLYTRSLYLTNSIHFESNLKKLKKAAEGEENLMPYILDCVHGYATLGETCSILREVFGEYEEPAIY